MNENEGKPTAPTVAIFAEDLSLANLEGTGWFGYGLNRGDAEDGSDDTLMVELYGEDGEIEKRFIVALTVTEVA